MDELIKRLAAASEGSRGLDAAIEIDIEGVSQSECNQYLAAIERHPKPNPWDCFDPCCPHYTTSIDAALTLLPEGWKITHAFWDAGATATFCLTKKERVKGEDTNRYSGGISSTPALALCIACLKARKEAQAIEAEDA